MLLKMQKLEVLDLSYNKIGYVDPDAGTCLKELTTSRATSSGPRLCPVPVSVRSPSLSGPDSVDWGPDDGQNDGLVMIKLAHLIIYRI